jgi:Na+/proline symporter
MSSMDAGLNKNAGIFVKNFYQPHFRPDAHDKQLLAVGKVATLVLGAIVILVGLEMSRLRGLGLFLLMQRISILIATPIIVPLLLGIIVRRTPPWSAWTTVLVGFASSLVISRWFPPEWAAHFFGVKGSLTASTAEYWTQASSYFGNVIVSVAWFLGTGFFWSQTSPAYQANIEAFFIRLNTPVDFDKEEGAHAANDDRQSAAIGWLCLVYGLFVVLLAFIPNSTAGRLAFVGSGGAVLLVGAVLVRSVRQPNVPRPETS